MKMFKRLLRWALSLAMVFAVFAVTGLAPVHEAAPPRPHRQQSEDPSNARVIVKFRADSGLRKALSGRSGKPVLLAPQHASVLATRLNMPLENGRVLGTHTQLIKGKGMSSSQLMARLTTMADVEWAVVDERRYIRSTPNDPYFGPLQALTTPTVGQWYLRAPDPTVVSAINALGAWGLSTGSNQVTVAVLDTGVRFEHPDLASKLYPGYDFLSDATTANDGTGRDADASDPGDASNPGECGYTQFYPSSWHGTEVAGIVGAATNNGIGIAGTGRDVMVLPVRVMGVCGGVDSDIIAAMRWAAGLTSDVGGGISVVNTHPAKVINMSLGSSTACSPAYIEVLQALNTAGVTVVVAAGNEEGLATGSPANCPGALAVAGLRHIGTKVGFSSMGPEVAIAAPGGNCVNLAEPCLYPIMTTSNAGQTDPQASIYTDSYHYSVGTSFAAPQVSGTVGLMLSLNPALSPADIRFALQASARPFPVSGAAADVLQCQAPSLVAQDECYCTTSTCGAGMLDAAAALAQVNPFPTARITVDTSALLSSKSIFVSGATSTAAGNRTLTGYQWTLLSGQQFASFAGSTTAATATVVFVANTGSVEVQLRVTDSNGDSNTVTQTLSGAPAAAAPVGSSGGGGSVSAWWVAALMLACAWLWRLRWAAPRTWR
jgi:serine protease